jgi:hypothetical protein
MKVLLMILGTFSLKMICGQEYVDTVYKVIPITFDRQTSSWSALLGRIMTRKDFWEPFPAYSKGAGSFSSESDVFKSADKANVKRTFTEIGLAVPDMSLAKAELYSARLGKNYVFLVVPHTAIQSLNSRIQQNYDAKLELSKQGKFRMEEVSPLLYVQWIPVQEIIDSINNPKKTWAAEKGTHRIDTNFKKDLSKLWGKQEVQENIGAVKDLL